MRHVVPPASVLSRWSAHADAAQRERLEQARAEVADAAAVRELKSPVEVSVGSIAEELADAARPNGNRRPLLVLGRRTHRERGGGPGSTATRVLALTDAPVLMYLPDR
jgi:nucleotide-binding universal stress UspA family protein